jgi:hypothetical protein
MGERRGAYRVLVGKPEGRRPLGRPRRRWEDNIKMDLREVGRGAQTGLIWLRVGTDGGLLCIRWWTFGFHKMRGIYWVAYDILASQEGLVFHGVSLMDHRLKLTFQRKRCLHLEPHIANGDNTTALQRLMSPRTFCVSNTIVNICIWYTAAVTTCYLEVRWFRGHIFSNTSTVYHVYRLSQPRRVLHLKEILWASYPVKNILYTSFQIRSIILT